ncbi:methionine adenosyltransferase [Porphyromonas somerae]|uniref:S-adenosylmethionine synthase n=1 Tax=Porphyromonas somerae TaxID=322095 RepID=A0A134B0R5_9PORP|nr:methionine adenosyltransferase [Porphyromonas somerae]KXB71557.1 methionine adenosyltransferase [Porphyromonadaceae bacterium KA00676]KXB73535.1 methionine adenosyltransferase [Porphyromonas somerae]
MSYLFTSESVSEGHPDKVADQISDAILDHFMALDPHSKVACETLVTTGQVVLAGEVKSDAYVELQDIARDVIREIGYNKSAYCFDADSCGVLSAIHGQSADINRGVERTAPEEQGAGDQGIMFGYACRETPSLMPLTLDLSHALLEELARIRKEELHLMPYLRPDAKSQVTVEYSEEGKPLRIDTIVISTQHDDFIQPTDATTEAQAIADAEMQARITEDIRRVLLPRVFARYPEDVQRAFDRETKLLVNPTGKFVIGGPHGDTGLTGRKIIVDTYGGKAAHGGGAFSGKDPSKVDRSAAYAARHIAKNLVAAGIADEVLVQLAYAIGVAEPISIFVNTNGTSHVSLSDAEIAKLVDEVFDLRPYAIEQRLKLRAPIYRETASYGHFGREPRKVTKYFSANSRGNVAHEVELFTWEKLDYVDTLRQRFDL